MRKYSPPCYSHPRRGYDGARRSSGRREYGGGRRREQNHGSLLVRNVPLDCRPEELRVPFERFGPVRDVYMPKDYYTGKPRGFAFVQYIDPYDASEAHYHMNGQIFAGREISVVFSVETRKRPEEMRQKARLREPVHSRGKPSYHGRSRSRSASRSGFSHHHSRYNSRSSSPAPRGQSDHSLSPRRHAENPRSPRSFHSQRQRSDYSVSPRRQAEHPPSPRSFSPAPRQLYEYSVSPRRQGEHPKSRRGPPAEPDGDQKQSSYSPGYGKVLDCNQINGYGERKHIYKSETAQGQWRQLPLRASRSPIGSRSRSADLSPGYKR